MIDFSIDPVEKLLALVFIIILLQIAVAVGDLYE